jgi:SAM-dependent methyltransferase
MPAFPRRSLARRFPPPQRPWEGDYGERHLAFTNAMMADADILRRLRTGRQLPRGYGIGLDERVVEYIWLAAQEPRGRTLDAGSVLNHGHVLDWFLPRLDELTIITLKPEPAAFPERGVRYAFGDLRELPFEDASFDTAVCLSTIEHVGMDNSLYGDGTPRADDPRAEVHRALAELERVTAPGGRVLLSVPYGAPEDHGWFRQFDQDELEALIAASASPEPRVTVYAYGPGGWRRSSPPKAAGATYHDHHADPTPDPDRAPAARAVACVELPDTAP